MSNVKVKQETGLLNAQEHFITRRGQSMAQRSNFLLYNSENQKVKGDYSSFVLVLSKRLQLLAIGQLDSCLWVVILATVLSLNSA